MSEKKKSNQASSTSTIAKSGDGTIQITFNIPFSLIKKNQKEVAEEIGKNIEVPGFRKGKAPLDKVVQKIPKNTLLEKTLERLLPKLFSDAMKKHKIKPAIYPKFELVKAKEDEDWQVRATTCEIPNIDLGSYKKGISGIMRSKSIWTPDKDKKGKSDKEPTKQEKEQAAINYLLENVKITVPRVLIDEEVNHRLSNLLARIEKLGLSLESYLSSIGKTSATLREDYQGQAEKAIKIDLILTAIASKDNIKVEKEDVENALKGSKVSDSKGTKIATPDQERLVESMLTKQRVLDSLISTL